MHFLTVVATFSLLLFSVHNTGSLTPEKYFGDSYTQALDFCMVHRQIIEKECNKYSIDPAMAISVVFPELLRYERLHDLFETSALELLYVQAGKQAADFSIGRFQMKPSFAETIEKTAAQTEIPQKPSFLSILPPGTTFTENTSTRQNRLERLKTIEGQLQYLSVFVQLVNRIFETDTMATVASQLVLLSSAYNRGINASYAQLMQLSSEKSFPYGKNQGCRFSYPDVSLYFYEHHARNIFKSSLSIH